MTAFIEFFCDYCNPGGERRDEGQEDPSGYARELLGQYPLGWWEVPHKGPGGASGHACPKCVMGRSDVREDIAQRRGLETKRLLGELDDAPERLVAFLYMVTRDLLPARYVEHLVSFIESDRKVSADPDLKAWADRMARRLMYDDKAG